MIKYEFLQDNGGRPYFDTNKEYSMLWEITGISTDYLRQIVEELEEVKRGERERCSFGSEGTTTIFCTSDSDNAIIFYEDTNKETGKWEDKQLEVPLEEIYNLMNDWLKYIENWEKETGEKFPR